MPTRCFNGNCFWEPAPTDDDVSGHSSIQVAQNFVVSHQDDPEGGHLVRIRFDSAEDERTFLAALDQDRAALRAV